MSIIHSAFNLFQPIAIGSDHAGFDYKEELKQYLQSKGLNVKDFGTHSKESVDYPDFAHPVASAVENGECGFGILLCGSANGVAITASEWEARQAVTRATEEAKTNRAVALHADVDQLVSLVLLTLGSELADALLNQGIDVDVRYSDTSGWYSNYRTGETTAAAKLLIDRSSDRVVGAHLLGPEYGELINFLALAMKLDLTTRQLKSMTAAYPTVGSDLGSML